MPFSWGTFGEEFLAELVGWLDGRSVLEVFAGNGLLARGLSSRGVDVVATTLLSGHDGHERGMHFDVVEMAADRAVERFPERDVLVMSWPTGDEGAMRAAVRWGEGRPMVFIGEVTRLDRGQLGGCASDAFFELTEETIAFGSYRPRNALESAGVRVLLPGAVMEYGRRAGLGTSRSFGLRT